MQTEMLKAILERVYAALEGDHDDVKVQAEFRSAISQLMDACQTYELPEWWMLSDMIDAYFNRRRPDFIEFATRTVQAVEAAIDAEVRTEAMVEATAPEAKQITNEVPEPQSVSVNSKGSGHKPKRELASSIDNKLQFEKAILEHHGFNGDSVTNLEPITWQETKLTKSVAYRLFYDYFGGIEKYRYQCGDTQTLIASLKLLSGETKPHVFNT